MTTFLNIIFIAPASFPHNESPYAYSWVALSAFIVFLLMIYVILSPGKRKKSKM